MTDVRDLPDDIDPELWFVGTGEHCNGGHDYLYVSRWHTHPGRMAAYCPHDSYHPDYRTSKLEMDPSPLTMGAATRYFVMGFLEGNCPNPQDPDDYWDSPSFRAHWDRLTRIFIETGYWDPGSELLAEVGWTE